MYTILQSTCTFVYSTAVPKMDVKLLLVVSSDGGAEAPQHSEQEGHLQANRLHSSSFPFPAVN
jgi:hypothetical protein